jgi:hypothetical protein
MTGRVGSMICSTLSVTRRCCWLGGVGCGATRAPARPGWTARRPTTSSGSGARTPSRRAAGRSEGPEVCASARAGADDPQARRQQAPAWHPDRAGPGGASRPEAGAGADPGGGLPTLFLWVPPRAPRAGCHRRGPPVHQPRLRVGAGGRYHGVLRRAVTCRHHRPAAATDRRQAGPGAGQGVPQGGHPHRGWRRAGHDHWHPARRDPLTAAQQPGPVGPRRPLHRGVAGRGRHLLGAAVASTQGAGDLAAGPLRRRFRRVGRRHPRACRGAAGGGRSGARLDGAAPVGGQDQDLPYRRGLRLPRVPHPAAPKARRGQALRLHLPRQEGPGGGQGEATGAVPQGQRPAARHPATPAQPGAARMDQLLQARGLQGDLQLPACLCLAAGGLLAAPQASPRELEVAAAALPPGVVADRRGGHAGQPRRGRGQPLPLPGPHPSPWIEQPRPIIKGSH